MQGQPYGTPGQGQAYPPHGNPDIPAPLQPSHPGATVAAHQSQYRAYTPASLQVGGGGSGESGDVSDYYR